MRENTVLWWGHFDPEYSRNRIMRNLLRKLGWAIIDFNPYFSATANIEAILRRIPPPDLVWVPCFRQRDISAAYRWSKNHNVPLLFDPLISAYDKQVFERVKFAEDGRKAKRMLKWESSLFKCANHLLADTQPHAYYFNKDLGVPAEKISVVYVGAEEQYFYAAPPIERDPNKPIEVLFYGSFIPLQGPQTIINAAKRYYGPPVQWTLIGNGPLHNECQTAAREQENVRFEQWMPYQELASRIHQADILLGIFGTTAKAARVIPNKVFQSLACGRAVITQRSNAYPDALLRRHDSGLLWSNPGDPQSLAEVVAELAANPRRLHAQSFAAEKTYRHFFSEQIVTDQLRSAVDLAQSSPNHIDNLTQKGS